VTDRLAHRWPGFADDHMTALMDAAGLVPGRGLSVSGPFETRLWTATLPVEAAAGTKRLEFAQ
ncbi:MAG: hypothetical protein M3N26_01265, partial [Pseudomonadota bacterium]|nr:hypothetical protein [Pseudomonadota bacterium]